MKTSYLAMTGYDGPAPGFEIWPAPSYHCEPSVAVSSVERTLSLCELAEALGFDGITVAEHHYAPYMMTPNPMVMAAAITQRVKRARISLMGPLVPLNNPVRIAEELAMLDVLSGGRISVMPLRGTPNEHQTYDTHPEKTRSMTQEGIDLVIKALQETTPFSWHGENYNYNTISIWPRPVQAHIPIFGSGNSEESIRFAAERRIGIGFSFVPVEIVGDWVELYRRECARFGWEPTPAHIIYRGIAYLADTDEAADAGMMAHFGRQKEEQAKLQSETMGGPPLNSLILSKAFFSGSPATVIQICETLSDVGVGMIDTVFSLGSHDEQVNAMKLFASEVIPVIHGWSDTHFARSLSPISAVA